MKTKRNMARKISVIVERTDTGFSAYAEHYPAFTTGRTVGELLQNIVEALNICFEEIGESKKAGIKDISMSYSLPSLFELYPINVKKLADRIGMNYTLLSQYVQGRKKPSEKQTEKIIEGLQEIGRELSQVHLI